MKNTIKTYTIDGMKTFQIGDTFLVGQSGSGRSVFGEKATLTKITKMHLVFTTECGTVVKTKIDNLNEVIGKAGKQNIFVSEKVWEDGSYMKRNTVIL